MAEIELRYLTGQCIDQRVGEKAIVAEEIRAWTKEGSKKKILANWQCREGVARVKLREL